MTRFLIKTSSFLCLIFALLMLTILFGLSGKQQDQVITWCASLFFSGIISLAIGRIIDLLESTNLYNRILTEKLAGEELAKYMVSIEAIKTNSKPGSFKKIV